ncbi:Uncharacterised protein [Klebsiella pneumoniae]|nr:Uncharacterised protein [Klebsiella pneumoniae]
MMLAHDEMPTDELVQGFVNFLNLIGCHITGINQVLLVPLQIFLRGRPRQNRETMRQHKFVITFQQYIELAGSVASSYSRISSIPKRAAGR